MAYAMAIGIIISVMLGSCRTIREVEYIERTDTQKVFVERIDSILVNVHDSTAQDIRRSGDTIFITKYKERTVYKYIVMIQHDTLESNKIENVDKEVVIEKQYIPRWCYACATFCIFAAIFIFAKLTIIIRKIL